MYLIVAMNNIWYLRTLSHLCFFALCVRNARNLSFVTEALENKSERHKGESESRWQKILTCTLQCSQNAKQSV
jgi:hypothetical protein